MILMSFDYDTMCGIDIVDNDFQHLLLPMYSTRYKLFWPGFCLVCNEGSFDIDIEKIGEYLADLRENTFLKVSNTDISSSIYMYSKMAQHLL